MIGNSELVTLSVLLIDSFIFYLSGRLRSRLWRIVNDLRNMLNPWVVLIESHWRVFLCLSNRHNFWMGFCEGIFAISTFGRVKYIFEIFSFLRLSGYWLKIILLIHGASIVSIGELRRKSTVEGSLVGLNFHFSLLVEALNHIHSCPFFFLVGHVTPRDVRRMLMVLLTSLPFISLVY